MIQIHDENSIGASSNAATSHQPKLQPFLSNRKPRTLNP